MKLRLLIVFLAWPLLAAPMEAEQVEIRKGAFDAVLAERCSESNLQNIFKRMQYKPKTSHSLGNDYRINEESYAVYVPLDYTTDTAYGLLVWISAGERGNMPKGWEELMGKHKLIWIGRAPIGEQTQGAGAKDALALDAVSNMKYVHYIQVPGMGHEMPTMEWYGKAIVFLDTAVAKAVNPIQEKE